MNDERIRSWASTIGPNTLEVIDRIFRGVQIKEQGYNSALSVLRLSKAYSDARLETACELALTRGTRSPRYRHLKAILASNQDIAYLEQKTIKEATISDDSHIGYLRGDSYYGGNSNV